MAMAAAALVCSLAALAGWVLDVRALTTFGVSERQIWPLSTIGFSGLSGAFLLLLIGRLREARLALALPIVIAIASTADSLIGDFDGGWSLIGALFGPGDTPQTARPSNNAVATFFVLGIAGIRASLIGTRRDPLMAALGTGAFVLGVAALALIIAASPGDAAFRVFSSSVPASVITMLLGGACLAWSSDFALLRLFTRRAGDERQLSRLMLPAALLLPILPSLLSLWLVRAQEPNSLTAELVVVLCNVGMVSTLIYWAVTRITAEHAALLELSEALEGTTVAITTIDGRITHWSQGCVRLYGWTAAEARGQNIYALLGARCQQWWATGFPHASGGDALELIEVHRDGYEIAVVETCRRVESKGRPPVQVLSMNDISQTATAMAALRASEERLAMATAAHQVGVFEWDVSSGRITWSPGVEQRLGLDPGTLATFESWRAQVEPEDVQAVLETIARTVSTRAETFTFRYRFRDPNGSVRAVEGSARTFYDDAGNLRRTVGAILDVTEREAREAAIRAREAQLRSILQTVPDAMVVMNERGTILQFSATAEALWGYRAESVLGRHFTMLVPEEDRSRYTTRLAKMLETVIEGEPRQPAPATGETADGRVFPLEVRTGIARVEGRLILTIFCRDLTQQLASEERLSELNTELAHVSRQSAMSELAADMAHELNQPLTATANFLAAARMLMEKGEGADRVVDLVRMGIEQTQRAGQIIRRLRDFMARREVEMRAERLEEVLQDAVELVLVGTGQFHIRMRYALDSEIRWILADRVQVQQVFVNLLRNAMDALRAAAPGDREITIESYKSDGNMVEIAISDTGPGIPPAVLENLFSRFTTTKGQKGGMGIGLSISKRIIEAHGGTLSAGNRPEGGAVFRFTLPAAGEHGA